MTPIEPSHALGLQLGAITQLLADLKEDVIEIKAQTKRTNGRVTALEAKDAAADIGDRRFEQERDRRYEEVAQEREKALKIKETADLAALELAREIQTYKDQKTEATIQPLMDFSSSQQGRQAGIGVSTSVLVGALTSMAIVLGAVVAIVNLLTQ